MKRDSRLFLCKFAVPALLLGCALFIGGPASAQNLLNNPGFEAPIATSSSVLTNWTVKYVYGGPDDFCLRDRSTFANHSGIFGAHFRPVTEGVMNAYLTQTVTGLQPGTNYVVSGWMLVTWGSGVTSGKYSVTIETVGGSTASTPSSTSETWTQLAVTNTPKANGTLEVRLRYNKAQSTVITDNKGLNVASGCWDDISMTAQ